MTAAAASGVVQFRRVLEHAVEQPVTSNENLRRLEMRIGTITLNLKTRAGIAAVPGVPTAVPDRMLADDGSDRVPCCLIWSGCR